MAEFDRAFLEAHGVPENEREAVLEAHEAAMQAAVESMVSEEEAQKRVGEAVQGMVTEEEARKRIEAAVEGMVTEKEAARRVEEAVAAALEGVDGEAYRKVAAERDMLRAIGGEAFEGVKPKFREQVYQMLDLGPGSRPVAEQLEAIREEYEEFFVDEETGARMPRFGGPVRGSMPRGAIGAAEQFSLAWGFGPRR